MNKNRVRNKEQEPASVPAPPAEGEPKESKKKTDEELVKEIYEMYRKRSSGSGTPLSLTSALAELKTLRLRSFEEKKQARHTLVRMLNSRKESKIEEKKGCFPGQMEFLPELIRDGILQHLNFDDQWTLVNTFESWKWNQVSIGSGPHFLLTFRLVILIKNWK